MSNGMSFVWSVCTYEEDTVMEELDTKDISFCQAVIAMIAISNSISVQITIFTLSMKHSFTLMVFGSVYIVSVLLFSFSSVGEVSAAVKVRHGQTSTQIRSADE
jgi:hypothetical protein